jgi:hypothetical protein
VAMTAFGSNGKPYIPAPRVQACIESAPVPNVFTERYGPAQ